MDARKQLQILQRAQGWKQRDRLWHETQLVPDRRGVALRVDASYPPTHNIPGEVYDSGDDLYWTQPLQLNVGQSFFLYNPNGNETWKQGVNLQQ